MDVTRVKAVFNRARRKAIAPKGPADPAELERYTHPSVALNVFLVVLLIVVVWSWVVYR